MSTFDAGIIRMGDSYKTYETYEITTNVLILIAIAVPIAE